ncbi:MAG: hypothetical protein E6J90_42015 [Deltaproteobacteria bacterium]|nr:MAG: hypothetical protein E6J90_42015 [Deltaproteobacteria bacterium]TMQ14687.1 MAG: hypothetical protein E6J91_14740 [Deltaproteobacteria bacterium]
MSINTTKDPRADARADAAIDPPIASTPQPGVAAPAGTSGPDLESRIRRRRAELIGKLGELRPDQRLGAAEARDKVKAALSELAHLVKWGVVDGWASIGDPVTHKLEQWLADSARQLIPRREQP